MYKTNTHFSLFLTIWFTDTFCLTKTNLEQELKFFEIVYSDPEVNFKNSNFGLDNLNYNNFYNICAKNTWDEILLFLEKYHDNL